MFSVDANEDKVNIYNDLIIICEQLSPGHETYYNYLSSILQNIHNDNIALDYIVVFQMMNIYQISHKHMKIFK